MQDLEKQKRLPVDKTYIRPKKAASLLKTAQSIKQTVYIYGTTGFGKTALISDYLARRCYEYYSINDSEWQEEGMKDKGDAQERIVVVDDLHRLVSASEREYYYTFLKQWAEAENVWLILISRAPIPAWLRPLYIEQLFIIISENELRLSEDETADYFKNWGLSPSLQAYRQVCEVGKGQPLFLRIAAAQMQEAAKRYGNCEGGVSSELSALQEAEKVWCDYLESHVYDKWDLELQEFLLDISIVKSFNLEMAQIITRKSDAGRLILLAKESGNFLSEYTQGTRLSEKGQDTIYELRPQMRISMQRRLEKRYKQSYIRALYYRAGSSYELQGKLLEALTMYEKCRSEEGTSRLLIENTRRHAGIGHYWEFRKYYLALSEETVRQSPELMTGMSLLQSIIMNDEESERWYQELMAYTKEQTGNARKRAQARLLYLDIALPQRGTERMTEVLKHAWTFVSERKTILPELSLTNNQPTMMHGGKDFCEWSKCDRQLANTMGKTIELLLGDFGKGLVSLALAESFFEKGGDDYEISTLAQKGRMQALSGGKQEQVFVGVGILAWLSVFHNCMEDAIESLDSFRETVRNQAPRLLSGLDTLKVRFLLYVGRRAEVAEWMEQAPDENAEFCTLERYRYSAKVRVYLSVGRRGKARNLLEQLLFYAKKRQRIYLEMEAKVLLAIVQFRMKEDVWQETLQEAITQAEEYHFVRILSREGAALWELLKNDNFVWKDSGFRKHVLTECRQIALLYPSYLSEKKEGNVLLTEKAIKVLRLQAEGKTMEEIARVMGLSKEGVRYYNRETYKKLGVKNKAMALQEARNRNLI